MRFRHLDIAPVLAHLRSEFSVIDILAWDHEPKQGAFGMLMRSTAGPRTPEPARRVGVSEVEFFGSRGKPSHAALVVRHYFHINAAIAYGTRPPTLVEAVGHVEQQGGEAEFLLAGHPDGGLISVSRAPLPFQSGLKPITWWGP